MASEDVPLSLKTRRQRLGRTRKGLSIALGVSVATLARWENGQSPIRHQPMLDAALREVERTQAVRAVPATDADRFAVIWDLWNYVRAALRHGTSAVALRSDMAPLSADPFTELELFAKSSTHAARAVLILERAKWPAGMEGIRIAARRFRDVWDGRKLADLRNAIEHREEIYWNRSHPLHGSMRSSRFYGEDIPSASDFSFLGDPRTGPENVDYLGRVYDLSGAWEALDALHRLMTEKFTDANGQLLNERS